MESEGLDLLLVDSRHLLWRAMSVFHDLHVKRADESIQMTGGIYGWLRLALSTRYKFGGMVFACWDRVDGPTKRREMYPEYKNKPKSPTVTRKPRPAPTRYADDGVSGEYNTADRATPLTVEREVVMTQMIDQEVILKRILKLLGVQQASSPGWEADDVIATLVERYKDDVNIGILSGDRDLIQLVGPSVTLIRPLPKGEFEMLTPDEVVSTLGLRPEQILDLKALSGDSSDNIPGAKGIGPVGATKLIQEHQSWQKALTWAAGQPDSKLAQKLVASRQLVEISARLAALNRRAPLEFIDPARNPKAALMEIVGLRFNSLIADGRKEQLLEMGG
jgi:5'-3' exonuclease